MFPGRQQGVTVPESQRMSDQKGPPKTVAHVVPMQPYAVQWFDERGNAHNDIVYKIGNMVYYDRNAESWASGLQQASDFIKNAVNAEHAVAFSPPAPTSDTVDVLAMEQANASDSETA